MEKVKEIIKKYGVFVIGLAVFIFAAVQLGGIFMDYKKSDDEYENLEESYVTINTGIEISDEILDEMDTTEGDMLLPQENSQSTENTENTQSTENKKNKEDKTQQQVEQGPWYELASVNMSALKEKNEDVSGWLLFENVNISYPILYSGDNDTYLHTTFEGKSASAGSIFIEAYNTPDFNDSHTIIYGHNMKNLSMFGKLKYYNNNNSYYNNHQYFQIHTETEKLRYHIFSYHVTDVNGYVYQVPMYPDEEFAGMIYQMEQDSNKNTNVYVDENSKIITLSTCVNDDAKRFVIHAVLEDRYPITQ